MGESRFALADLIDVTRDGPVDLRPVVRAAARGDVEVATLTDEELHWLGDVDAAPRAYLDAPRLARLGKDQQDVALETAAWIMTARGEFDWDTRPARLHGLPAVVGTIRRSSASVALVRADHRGQGSRLSAVYEADEDLVMVEDVSDAGLHRFVLRTPRLAAAALAAGVDPSGRARSAGPPQTARTVGELDPSPDEMVTTCEASSLLYHAALTAPERVAARALTVYSGAAGVWVLAGRRSERAVWQQLDRAGLVDLLHAFLRRQVGEQEG